MGLGLRVQALGYRVGVCYNMLHQANRPNVCLEAHPTQSDSLFGGGHRHACPSACGTFGQIHGFVKTHRSSTESKGTPPTKFGSRQKNYSHDGKSEEARLSVKNLPLLAIGD